MAEGLGVRWSWVGVALNPAAGVPVRGTAESQEEEEKPCEDRAETGGAQSGAKEPRGPLGAGRGRKDPPQRLPREEPLAQSPAQGRRAPALSRH